MASTPTGGASSSPYSFSTLSLCFINVKKTTQLSSRVNIKFLPLSKTMFWLDLCHPLRYKISLRGKRKKQLVVPLGDQKSPISLISVVFLLTPWLENKWKRFSPQSVFNFLQLLFLQRCFFRMCWPFFQQGKSCFPASCCSRAKSISTYWAIFLSHKHSTMDSHQTSQSSVCWTRAVKSSVTLLAFLQWW